MFGIDPVTVTTMLVLAGNSGCPAHPPTKINVIPRTAEVKYETHETLKQIQSYSVDTVDPYGFHGTTITQGFMKGQIRVEHKVQLGQAMSKGNGAACVWYKDITVNIDIDPTIVIAKELYQNPCMRKAIIGHELKHVRVDREIVNKYAKSMGQKLLTGLKSRGFETGPFPITSMNDVSHKMQNMVGQLLQLEYKKLGIEREERQGLVDSLEEYKSVDAKCPSFQRKKDKLYADLVR